MAVYKNSTETARKLRKGYAVALSILAIMLILSQVIIQYAIHTNDNDSRVINIAGRQRMLSQRINKSVFGLYNNTDEIDHTRYLNELEISLDLWKQSHEGLQNGDKELGLPGKNSPQIVNMFQQIEPQYKAIVDAATEIGIIASKPAYSRDKLFSAIQIIKNNESDFLKGMDDIVFQYDLESKQKIANISVIEIFILLLSFFILGLEMLFIFRPALTHVKSAMEEVETGRELLRKEKDLLATTMLSIGVAVIVTDSSGKITLMNPLAERYTGWSRHEAYGIDYQNVFNHVNILTGEKEMDPVRYVIETGNSIETSKYEGLISKDGSEIRITGNAAAIPSENGEISGVVISIRDISKEYELEKEIEIFLDVNLDMLCVVDMDGNFHRVNKRFGEILGYSIEEVEGKSFMYFLHEEDIEATLEAIKKLAENKILSGFTNRYRCKDGSYKYIEWHAQSGNGKYIYSSARDVTEKRVLEEQLRKIAVRDELTGLYNRHYFDMIIWEEMERSDRYNEPLSLMLLDLDYFKKVNDTWGHPVGDELLQVTSRIMGNVKRNTDVLVRFGGEEFALLMPHTSIEGAVTVAEKIRTAIEKNRHPITGIQTISIGVSERMKTESFGHLYKRTDEALYRAKQSGRNRVVVADENENLPMASVNLEWRTEWESGNREIDRQHQDLIALAGHLIELSLAGRGYQETIYQLEVLLRHITNHFEFEERVLADIGYPDHQVHSDTHKRLLAKAMGLEEAYKNGEIKSTAFFSFIVDDVILGHMVDSDTEFFPYLGK